MVFEKIREVIARTLDIDAEKITLASSVKDDFQADSLDLFEIVMEIEEHYGIEIDTDSIGDIKTVEELVKVVEGLI